VLQYTGKLSFIHPSTKSTVFHMPYSRDSKCSTLLRAEKLLRVSPYADDECRKCDRNFLYP